MNSPEQPRTLRDGRYVVIGILGEGAQAATLDAVDKRDGRPVAIKEFRVRGARSWKDVELAEREARVLSTLAHPNLPVYVDHFEEDGALFLVTERIEGEPLSRARKRGIRFDHAGVRRFLTDAASTLDYLHGRRPPIVHRDIKPGNVIRRPDGSFAFVDFGSVRESMKPEGGSTVVGTFGYMAPEQFQGRAGPGSDVYAVGATALSLITGCEPEDLPHRGLAIDVQQALGTGADPALVRILSSMLEPDPDRRPTRVTPLIAELDGATHGRSSRRSGSAWNPAHNPSSSASTRSDWRARMREERAASREERKRIKRELKDEARRQAYEWKFRVREWHDWGREWERYSEQFQNSAEWQRRRQRWRRRPHPAFVMFASLVLMVARTANWALFRVMLPTVLTLLSVIFGRELRFAAQRVRQVGAENDRGLRHASDRVRDLWSPARAAATPPQPNPNPSRVRVDPKVQDVEGVELEEEEDRSDEPRAKRRGEA